MARACKQSGCYCCSFRILDRFFVQVVVRGEPGFMKRPATRLHNHKNIIHKEFHPISNKALPTTVLSSVCVHTGQRVYTLGHRVCKIIVFAEAANLFPNISSLIEGGSTRRKRWKQKLQFCKQSL